MLRMEGNHAGAVAACRKTLGIAACDFWAVPLSAIILRKKRFSASEYRSIIVAVRTKPEHKSYCDRYWTARPEQGVFVTNSMCSRCLWWYTTAP